ncbi:hypothetical protein GZH46_02322, partial [Fragariocoptes setiger]
MLDDVREADETNEWFAKIDTLILGLYQFSVGEPYYFHREVPHRRYFRRVYFHMVNCFELYFLTKAFALTQLVASIIQLERETGPTINTWWRSTHIDDECFRAHRNQTRITMLSHSTTNMSSSIASIASEQFQDNSKIRTFECSRIRLLNNDWLDFDPYAIVRSVDPLKFASTERIKYYCIMTALTLVLAVVLPMSRIVHRFNYRYLEFASNPQQTLRTQARYIYKHQVNLKHVFYYNIQRRRYDYYRARPYVRSDDWLKWSVRLRVAVNTLGQSMITVPLAVMLVWMTLDQENLRAGRPLIWHLFVWKDFVGEVSVAFVLFSLVIGPANIYLTFPIMELSFWLDEIRLQLCTAVLLLRHSRQQLHQVCYSLADHLRRGDIQAIRLRQSQAIGNGCRITSLPHFLRISNFRTRKRYQQLIAYSVAANYAYPVDRLIDDIYFGFYLFAHEFESVNEIVSLVISVSVMTMGLIAASLLYLSQYLSGFDTIVAVAMGLAFVLVNLLLIITSHISLKIRSLCPIIFSMLSEDRNHKRHQLWIEIVQRWFYSSRKLGFRVFGYGISYQSFLQVNVYVTSAILLSYSELLRHIGTIIGT